MSSKYAIDESTALVTMNMRKLIMIMVVGVVAGLITWGLSFALDVYVYKAILCNTASAVQCTSSGQYAATSAYVIGAAVALFGLVRLHVYRPLLVILATFVSLWGLVEIIAELPGYLEAIICAIIFGIALGAFAWLVRIRNFIVTLLLVILLTIAVRLVLIA